ncbi:MAG: hypothetical protein ABI390_06135 [Daejeonella sp.]
MKKPSAIILAFIVLVLVNFSCKKDNPNTFCDEERSNYLQVTDQEGYIHFSNQNARYTISLDILPSIAGNIDSFNSGYVCELPAEYRKEGMKVRVSGTLKNFNDNEDIDAAIGGEHPYFFDYTSITPATSN